ncbi:MAG: CsbD family protein [Candidatus Nitrosoglobus sp.]
MNWDEIEGDWKQFKGKIRQKWAELTEDDVEEVGGKKDVLVGKLQKRYGIAKDEAEKQINDFGNSCR